jgi:hypothetical protein
MKIVQKKLIFIIFNIIILINPLEIYPLKKTNQNIKKAESLIKEKKYNDASKILSEELVNDPENEYKIMKLLNLISKEREKVISMIYEIKDSLQKQDFEKADKLLSILPNIGDFDSKINNLVSILLKEKEPLKKIIMFNNLVVNNAEKLILQNDIKDAMTIYKKALDLYRNESVEVNDPNLSNLIKKFNTLENQLSEIDLNINEELSSDNVTYDDIIKNYEKSKAKLTKWKKSESDFTDLLNLLEKLNTSTKKEIKYEAYRSITQKYINLLRKSVQIYGNYCIDRLFFLIDREITRYDNKSDSQEIINKSFSLIHNLESEAFYNISLDYDNSNYIKKSNDVIISYLSYITKKNILFLKYRQTVAMNDFNITNKYYEDYLAKKNNKEYFLAKDLLLKSNDTLPQVYKSSNSIQAKLNLYKTLKDENFSAFQNKNIDLVNKTDALSLKIKNGLNEINDILNYINGLLSDADKAYNDSVNLYNQKSYSKANESFLKTKDKYIDIRVQMKSDYVENQIIKIDDYLDKIEEVSFKQDINNAEQYLETAKLNFYQEKYDDAKNNIEEADKIYKRYNQNEDLINYYRERILSAIKIQSGSKLSIDDSAYNQIVELFKNARLNFDKGDYDKAYEYITQILLEKPYYEEARLFEIKILQKKDIKSFNEIYTNYYKKAVDIFNAKKYDDALLEFKQLLQFNKNINEIESYIYKCKVALNLTKPTVTAEDKNRATNLIKQAQNDYAAGDYQKAYDNINEALKLWEDVPDARSIKLACMQKLKIERPKLTIDNEVKFREANRAYSENDFETAFKLTNEILKTQDNEEVRRLNRKAELKIKNR